MLFDELYQTLTTSLHEEVTDKLHIKLNDLLDKDKRGPHSSPHVRFTNVGFEGSSARKDPLISLKAGVVYLNSVYLTDRDSIKPTFTRRYSFLERIKFLFTGKLNEQIFTEQS